MKRNRTYLRKQKQYNRRDKKYSQRLFLTIEKARKRYKENPKELLKDGLAYINAFKSVGIDMSCLTIPLLNQYVEMELDKIEELHFSQAYFDKIREGKFNITLTNSLTTLP